MACNGLSFGNCNSGNSACFWTLIAIAAVLVWINCGCGNCNG